MLTAPHPIYDVKQKKCEGTLLGCIGEEYYFYGESMRLMKKR